MTWAITGTLTLGIYAKKAGVWVKITERTVTFYDEPGAGGSYTRTFDATYDIDMGTGVQAFGFSIEEHTGTAAALTDFVSAIWTGMSSSGDRSATPSGQSSTITVRPQ